MKKTIGAELIKDLKKNLPTDKEFLVQDDRTRGFLIRIQPPRTMVFYVQLARGKRLKIGHVDEIKPTVARDIAERYIADFKRGIDPIAEKKKAKAGTLADYLEKTYGPWVEANRKTGADTLRRIKASFPDLLKIPIGEITPWQVDKWRSAKLKLGRKASSLNRDLVALKACLSKAVEWSIIEEHPLSKVKPQKVDRAGKVRFLSPDEEAQIREALDRRTERMRQERDSHNEWLMARNHPPLSSLRSVRFSDHLEPLFLLSINTGCRRGELFNLNWPDVDLGGAVLTVAGDTAKSGTTRHIPLNNEALETLRAWRKQTTGSGYVFPGKKDGERLNNVKKSWDGALKAAGVEGFRWHDIRHTFASKLVMAGIDLNTVRELLGHSDFKMTLRYAHLAPEHKAKAVAVLDAVKAENQPDHLTVAK